MVVQAKRVRADYSAALRMLHPSNHHWQPKAVTCSALLQEGIAEVWNEVKEFSRIMRESGDLDKNRSKQAVSWMWKEIREMLMVQFKQHPQVEKYLMQMECDVQAGKITPTTATIKLLQIYNHNST